ERMARKLFAGQGWSRWASLSPQLPLLAEAAPQAFLDAVAQELKELVKLFTQEGDAFFVSHPHTGLLWALEVVAWDRTFLSPVSRLLAALDEAVGTGKTGNNPARSFHEIFMPWFPQTNASVEERVKVLRKLIKDHPKAGWRLLIGLLPNQHMVSTPT